MFSQKPPPSTRAKLLSHFGDGSVAILLFDTPLDRSASTPLARTTIRRICGAPSLGNIPLELRSPSCPQCGLNAGEPEALERTWRGAPMGAQVTLCTTASSRFSAELLRKQEYPRQPSWRKLEACALEMPPAEEILWSWALRKLVDTLSLMGWSPLFTETKFF